MPHTTLLRSSRRLFLQRGAAASFWALSGASTFGAEASKVIAQTRYGKVRGLSSDGSLCFKGIPYARTVDRLWPPAQPESWEEVRDAFAFGPRALQVGPSTTDMSESCQTLNIWTPELKRGKRPVMVWLHGGGFMNGSANTDLYDGTDLNREGDVVVVTLNHRLGAFGFLDVSWAGCSYSESGCAGMLDIVAALEWVRDNIAEFGGDPHNVTIFGESGGGGKVMTLMAMPSAKGLFHRAIVESGALLRTAITQEEGSKNAIDLLAQMNLTPADIRAFLNAPAERVLQAQAAVLARAGTPGSGGSVAQRPFSPVIGKEIPLQPFDQIAPSVSAHVPMIIGTNKEETRFFFTSTPALYDLPAGELRARLEPLLGKDTDATLSLYRKTRPDASATDLFFAISTAQMYWYTSTRAAERKAKQGRSHIYMYQFAYEGTQMGGNGLAGGEPVPIKAGHSMEIPFVFAHPRPARDGTVPEHERRLAGQMSQAWIAFARTGDPNHPGIPKWPGYDAKRRATLFFDRETKVVNAPHEEERRFWEKLLTRV